MRFSIGYQSVSAVVLIEEWAVCRAILRAGHGATDVPTRTGWKCESRGDLTGLKRRLRGRLSERGVGFA